MTEILGPNLTWASLLPPIVAIIFIIITKESVFSLVMGAFIGCLVFVGFRPIKALEMMLDVSVQKITSNVYVIIFLALLGALIMLVMQSGGAIGYGEWIGKKIKTGKGSQIATAFIGMMFFIDDYFNCLTVGTVMNPVIDKHKVSREKLAYLTHSTAVPMCILIPISSWTAIVISTLEGSGRVDAFDIFIKSIPYNFYAIFTLIIMWSIILLNADFGPMLKFEERVKVQNIKNNQDISKKSLEGNPLDLIIPIIVLIVVTILSILYTGGFFSGESRTIFEVLKNTESAKSLTFGAVGAVVVAFIMMIFITKSLKFKYFMEGISEGIKSMTPAYIILILAWTIGGVCNRIGTDKYVESLFNFINVPFWSLPLIIFLISGFLAFATGTAWGTFGILIPVVVGICHNLGDNVLVNAIGATLAGAVLGNHSSPISDMCVLSATGARCNHIDHVISQIPYVLLATILCCIAYIIVNFISSLIVVYIGFIFLIILSVYVLGIYNKESKRRKWTRKV